MEGIGREIITLLEELGFEKTNVNGQVVYKYGNSYYRISYIESFSAFVIEYAENHEEAEKNVFWDGDLYPVSLGDNLVEVMRSDLIMYYMDESV